MKHIITAIALLAVSAMPMLAGEATASTAPQLDRTQEYRIWSAEQMLERVTNKFAKMVAIWMSRAASRGQRLVRCLQAIRNQRLFR